MQYMSAFGLIFYLFLSFDMASGPSPKTIQVVLRQIGHRILLSSGDSTSRILPIETKSKDIYEIAFEKPLSITSDSLYKIVEFELVRIGVFNFVAELQECHSEKVYLSFLYSKSLDSITPCNGRDLPSGCYKIEITILENKWKGRLLLGFGLFIGCIIVFYFIFMRKREKNKILGSGHFETLGNYKFYPSTGLLVCAGHRETLTEKEAKLLSILLAEVNNIQNREQIMKKIWTDSGLIVGAKNVDVLVSKLRKKLAKDERIKITNVHGVGYKLEAG